MKPLFLFSASLLLLASCRFTFNTEKGSGNIVKKEESFGDFSKLEVSGNFVVIIHPSESHRVVIEADDNLQKFIILEKSENRVEVGSKNNVRLKPSQSIKIHVYMKEVNRVELSGSCNLETQGRISSSDRMDITMAGSSKANLDIDAPDLVVSMAGSGKVAAQGKTRTLKVKIAGSGAFNGPNLLTESADISISGSGDARVFTSVDLKVSIAGSGNVIYGGNPANVKKSVAGSGVVKPADQ